MVQLLASVVSLTSLFVLLTNASPAPAPQVGVDFNPCKGSAVDSENPLEGERCHVPQNANAAGTELPANQLLTPAEKAQGVLKTSSTFAKDAITCENVEALGLEYNTTKVECKWAAQRACDHFTETADGKNRNKWISVTTASSDKENEYCFVAFNIPAASGPSTVERCRLHIMQPLVDNCVQDHGPNTHGTLNLQADGSFVDPNFMAVVLRGVPSPTAKLPDGTCVNPNGQCDAPAGKLVKKNELYPVSLS